AQCTLRHPLTSRRNVAASTKSMLSKDDVRDFSRNRLTRVQLLSSPASLIGILSHPGQETHVVEKGSTKIEHREAGVAQMRLELCFRPVVRRDRPPDCFENRIGSHPTQAAHCAREALPPADRQNRGVDRNPTRDMDEDRPDSVLS